MRISGKVSVWLCRGADYAQHDIRRDDGRADYAILRLEAGVTWVKVSGKAAELSVMYLQGIVGLTKVSLCKNGLDRFCRGLFRNMQGF